MFERLLDKEDLLRIWNKTWPGEVQREKEELRGHISLLEKELKRLTDSQTVNLEIKIAMTDKISEQLLEIKRLTEAYNHQFDLRQKLADDVLRQTAEINQQGEKILELGKRLKKLEEMESEECAGGENLPVARDAEEPPQPTLERPEQVLTIDSKGGVSEEAPISHLEYLGGARQPDELERAPEEAPAKTEDPVA